MKFLNEHTRILYGTRPTDRSDPANAHTAVELDLPSNFSDKAKACWRYYEGAAFIYEYREKLYVTDESLELATDGDGTSERPFCNPRWICDSWEELEKCLETNYDEHLDDGILEILEYETNKRHLHSLIEHGARIKRPDGITEPLSMGHFRRALAYCNAEGVLAVTYEMELPGINENFMIAFWKNGHIDSGTTQRIFNCLAQ